MLKKSYKRTHYLINKNLQLTYTGMLVFYSTFITLILGFSIWYLNREYLNVFYKIAGEGAFPKAYIQSIENQFVVKLVIAMAVIAVLLFIIGVYTSHRIAGPLYRLTKYLNLIGIENNLSTVKIRKKDKLQGLAIAFNNMISTLEAKMFEDIKLIDALKGKIAEMLMSIQKGSTNQELLIEKMKEIDQITSKLMTSNGKK